MQSRSIAAILLAALTLTVAGANASSQDPDPEEEPSTPISLTGYWRVPDRYTKEQKYFEITDSGDRIVARNVGGGVAWFGDRKESGKIEGEIWLTKYDATDKVYLGEPKLFPQDTQSSQDGLSLEQTWHAKKWRKVDGVPEWIDEPDEYTRRIVRVGVARSVEPSSLVGANGAEFSFVIRGEELRYSGQAGQGPSAADVTLEVVGEDGDVPSGMVPASAVLQEDGSVLVTGRFNAAAGQIEGRHRIKLFGAHIPTDAQLEIDVLRAGIRVVDPPKFCLVGKTIEVKAERDSGNPDEAASIRFGIQGESDGDSFDPVESGPGALAFTSTFHAGKNPHHLSYFAVEGEVVPPEDSLEKLTVWDLDNGVNDAERRVGPVFFDDDTLWNDFGIFLRPQDTSLMELADGGVIRLKWLRYVGENGSPESTAEDATGASDAPLEFEFEYRKDELDRLVFTEESGLNDYLRIQPDRVLWNGRLPAEDGSSSRGVIPPEERNEGDLRLRGGRWRMELVVRNGEHEDSAEFEFVLRPFVRTLNVDGYYEMINGPGRGWIVRGHTTDQGLVSLDTAPGVVISGTWSGQDWDSVADLLQNGQGVAPYDYEIAEGIEAPVTLTGLRETRSEPPSLFGVPDGFSVEHDLEFRRLRWDVEHLTARSTFSFDPANGQDGLGHFSSGGREGGTRARIEFDRERYVPSVGYSSLYVIKEDVVVRFRLLDLDDSVLEELTWPAESQSGSLSISVGDEVYAYGEWTGLLDDGTPYPVGNYTLEIVVREDMAEETVRQRVRLGTTMAIHDITPQFAPSHDDVVVSFNWYPEDRQPERYLLDVTFTGDTGEDVVVVDRREVLPEKAGDRFWKVSWPADSHTVDLREKAWTANPDFKVRLTAIMDGGAREIADEAETTVVFSRVELEVSEPDIPSFAREFYDELDIPADVASLEASAKVFVIDSSGNEQLVPPGTPVDWTYEVTTEHGPNANRVLQLSDPQNVHDSVSDTRTSGAASSRAVKLELQDSHDESGSSRVEISVPCHSERETWDRDAKRIPADTFILIASIPSGAKEGPSATSATHTVAPGAPTPGGIRQLQPAEINQRLTMDDFNWESWNAVKFVETWGSRIAGWVGTEGSISTEAVRAALGDTQNFEAKYLGTVHNVPHDSFVLRALNAVDATGPEAWGKNEFEVFLAGFAGQSHADLKAGQALLVLFRVEDALGNPVPVSGQNARAVRTGVQTEGWGHTPPFILKSDDRSNSFDYGAELNYSPFKAGQSPDLMGIDGSLGPLGVTGFYYVPSLDFDTELLRQDIGSLELLLRQQGDGDPLRVPISHATAPELSVSVVWGQDRVFAQDEFFLAEQGSVIVNQTAAEKYLKWAIAGEVVDLETFKAEIALSVVPILGDGRDLAIYGLKNAFGSELSGWDHLFAGLALVGLILDVGDLVPPGLVANAVFATLKSTAKWLKTVYEWTSNAVTAFRRVIDPILEVANRSGRNAQELGQLILQRAGNFIEFMMEAGARGDGTLETTTRKVFEFVESCNPTKCLQVFCLLKPAQSWKFLEWSDELKSAFDMVARGLSKYETGENLREMFSLVETIASRMPANISEQGLLGLLRILEGHEDSLGVLRKLAGRGEDVLEPACWVLSREGFRDAILADPAIGRRFLDLIQETRYGARAAQLYHLSDPTRQAYARLHELVPHIGDTWDDIVELAGEGTSLFRPLDELFEMVAGANPRSFEQLGGAPAMQGLVRTLARLIRVDSEAAEAAVRIAGNIRQLPAGESALPHHLTKALENLSAVVDDAVGNEMFAAYVKAMDSFRDSAGALVPGLITQATRGASRNIVRVGADGIGASAIHEALEVVGTRWLIDTGTAIRLTAQSQYLDTAAGARRTLFSSGAIDEIVETSVVSFGNKAEVAYEVFDETAGRWVTKRTTFEGDTVLTLTVRGETQRFFVDWKNRGASAEIVDDIRRAQSALDSVRGNPADVPAHILFLAPLNWGAETARKVGDIKDIFTDAAGGFPFGRHVLLGQLDEVYGVLEHFIAR